MSEPLIADPGRGRPGSSGVRFALMALLAALSACASAEQKKKVEALVCPHVSIDRATSSLTRFKDGPGRDITDIELEGEIVGFNGDCALRKTGVDLNVMVRLAATRGPAAKDPYAEVEYFVAVTRLPPATRDADGKAIPAPAAERKILTKEIFKVGTQFPPGVNTVTYRDEQVDLAIPMDGDATTESFEIFVGYQLTREQLDYNRAHPK